MAIDFIYKDGESYTLEGETNIGRPLKIELKLGTVRKAEVSVAPALGSPIDEPFVEIELQNVMAEAEAIERRLSTIFEMNPKDIADAELLAQISTVVSRHKVTLDQVNDLLLPETKLGM